jgi:hypothetical protein
MAIKASKFKPTKGKIFVTDLERGAQKTAGGIIIPDDNMKETGIRERWGRVWRTGEDVDVVSEGEWLLMEHGRWTLAIDMEDDDGNEFPVWMIDEAAILLVSDIDQRPAEFKFT